MPRRHEPMNRGILREQIERVARIYHSNEDACRALGIVGRSFSRLCRKYDIETPYARRRRQSAQATRPRSPQATMQEEVV